MSDLHLRNRHPISDDEREEINEAMDALLGIRPLPHEDALVEKARAGEYDVLLVDGSMFVVLEGPEVDEPLPTLRALMENKPDRAKVTVDMGAVPFLRNGADVMSPGITDADESIEVEDVVWVVDEEHGAPLGIGYALMDGASMVDEDKGKAVATWHHVGDDFWDVHA